MVYIGAYFVIMNSKQEELVDVIRHPDSGKKMESKFDPETGVEGVVVPEAVYGDVSPYGYIEESDETLERLGIEEVEMFSTPEWVGSNDSATFILNLRNDKYCRFLEEGSILDLVELLSEDNQIHGLIQDFKEDFKPYLDYYRRTYGEFEVKFGVVNYDD